MAFFNRCELQLNFSPITLSSKQIEVYTSHFSDKESYQELRDEFPECVFHRRGDRIYCVPLDETSSVFGKKELVPIQDNLDVASRLIRESITRHFANNGVRFRRLAS